MNISDESVEAAACAFYGPAFDDVVHAERRFAMNQWRAALEAAAPHMMSDAWLEGRNSQPDKFAANPYWKDPA